MPKEEISAYTEYPGRGENEHGRVDGAPDLESLDSMSSCSHIVIRQTERAS